RDESDKVELRSAKGEAARLAQEIFPDLAVGLVHGDMKSVEKEEAMTAFRNGKTHVLVATTVIEVGVDVPNATIMIVQEADRFGLAQLHQLRGRVGRGAEQSWCLFVTRPKDELTEAARARLDALVRTTDGFELAEVDLEIRGEGQLLGTRQAGLSDLKFARLRHDRPLLARAKEAAAELAALDGPLADEVDALFASSDASA
ncbi:MAG: DNA helicase RecG, partial [Actinomycetota bacterium]|nr:DNA helicase RecG [Actinomycetota bacterium]